MAIWIRTNIPFMIMVVVPTDRDDKSDVTYGKLEIGDVPRSALMERATPRAMRIRPIASRMVCFTGWGKKRFACMISGFLL